MSSLTRASNARGRLYVAARPSDLPDESAYSEPLKPGWMKSVVKVSRNAGKLAVEFIHRKDVPRTST